MQLFDLTTASMALPSPNGWPVIAVEFGTGDALPLVADLPEDGRGVAVSFAKFSDGRGFTHARRLRAEFGFEGPLIATGHIIPDQAEFLRRCGFTHAAISDAEKAPQWQFALSIIPTRFQRVLDTTRSRTNGGVVLSGAKD